MSKEVEEDVFRGVEVPELDFDGWLPMSQANYPTDSMYQGVDTFKVPWSCRGLRGRAIDPFRQDPSLYVARLCCKCRRRINKHLLEGIPAEMVLGVGGLIVILVDFEVEEIQRSAAWVTHTWLEWLEYSRVSVPH